MTKLKKDYVDIKLKTNQASISERQGKELTEITIIGN